MEIKLNKISKKYEGRTNYTLENINLEISSQEFVVILGPSGCGKTTLLRIIAGLNSITKGDLLFDGQRVNELNPSERSLTMVFQSYALYPNLSVYNNIAYGLKIKKIRKDVIDNRVRNVAKILNITDYLYNKPKDLSGGQRQRVAIGRAIARKPQIFLMDEPLSNLDAKLRERMRKEIVDIHKIVGATTIYVTHDQLEAMTMATKIVLINDGQIQQVDSPIKFYNEPNNLFVASFIGSPTMNLIEGILKNQHFIANANDIKISVPHKIAGDKKVVLGIRPEDMIITSNQRYDFSAKIDVVELLGREKIVYANIDKTGQEIIFTAKSDLEIEKGKIYNFLINRSKVHLFDTQTTARYLKNGKIVKSKSD